MRVLLVDDEPAARKLIRNVLEERGHVVSEHEDAERAWQDFQQRPHDIAVLDLLLPGMDGLELCRRIRSLVGDATVVLITTARLTPKDLQQVLEAGADDYLDKPLSLGHLQTRLAIADRNAHESARRRGAEIALQESERLYRLLADHSTDMVSLHGPTGEFRYVSPSCRSMLGYEPGELIGHNAYDFHHPEDRQAVEASHRTILETRNVTLVAYRFRRRDGEYVWLESSCRTIRNAAGEVTEILCVSRDITARKETEAKLTESNERWRSLVENVPDFIAMIDRECRIRFINRTLPQFKRDEVLGKSCLEFIPADSRELMLSAVEKVFDTGTPQIFEIQATGADRWAWYVARLGPVRIEGMVGAAVFVATDITDRVEAAQAVERERELLKEMLEIHERERDVVAFEIHDGMVQTMTGSLMHLEAAEAQCTSPALLHRELGTAIDLLRRSIAEARLLIGGLRPPILEQHGIIAAIDFLIEEARRGLPYVEFTHPGSFQRLLPQLESAIFRIVQEALTNARRHSRSEKIAIDLSATEQRVRVKVRDWGVGFEPSSVSNERYGLRGIRERAKILEGHAVVRSAPGQGTTIEVDFPLLSLPERS
jgi:PAS domain S-box-containing protein